MGFIFVGLLYVLALCSLFLGGAAVFERAEFASGAVDAVMTSSDPNVIRAAKFAPNDSFRADVAYVSAKGTVSVSNKYLSADQVQRLARGEEVSLAFLERDPHRVLYRGEELPSGIGWLLLGVASLLVAIYAHRKLRREFAMGGVTAPYSVPLDCPDRGGP